MSGALSTEVRQGGSPAADLSQPQDELPAVAPTPDRDDAALAEARLIAEAEDAGTAAPEQPPQRPQQPAKPITVPKARLDEALAAATAARTEGEKWKERALYVEGALAARAAQQPPVAPPAAPAPAPSAQPTAQDIERQILALQAGMIATAKKFDAGEILAEELERTRIQADAQISLLRSQHLMSLLQAQIPEPQIGLADGQLMTATTADLEAQHAWTFEMREHDFAHIEAFAVDTLNKLGDGYRVTPGNLQDTLRVRHLVAQLTDILGPWFYPSRAQAVHDRRLAQAQAQRQQPNGQPPASPRPQQLPAAPAARTQDFAARYAAHPPPLQGVGTAGEGEDFSEERLGTMSTEELAALPATVRARYLQ
jgi:hypothetical protein